mmetsp:Transcript_13818/g.33449  ORF Transcript_13818/g.33449 Transcript_13818/m.33449 type:complete len:140 (+) Transcript_13818:159-578(+)|eukprot:CAMPEP_0113616088 /NCGR_PEP_ID=MMETSP0017_2-20120614/8052_1 /TAXON_ID=2856 /ORGANISM="Cylindrotheca closterium" /LENGTH=139 /DNA_ID=CAMNT_0000525377 /DNA_START=132 /DNA_END=551 /DNA_ORIENTATION=- /assembly_acc=CAM_ASM_000147
MGLLKHVLFPAFALVHGMSVMACMTLDGWAEMVNLELENGDADRESKRQLHMLGTLRAFNAAMCILFVLGVMSESSHYRSVLILAETVMFGLVTIDAYLLGLDFLVPAGIAAVALAGCVVHSKEPGIFTSDKEKSKKES